MTDLSPCTCYARKLPPTLLMALRRGAHTRDCVEYEPSEDPFDQWVDSLLRRNLSQEPVK